MKNDAPTIHGSMANGSNSGPAGIKPPISERSGSERSDSIQSPPVGGSFVELKGEQFYGIKNYDRMSPFLMSIISSGDLWMYVSSNGGLTAGRICAENCLFPYETVDKLHHCHPYTGPLSLVRCFEESGSMQLWHPFADEYVLKNACRRTLYKHVVGNHVVFEEIDDELGLKFSYSWQTSRQFGFVRTTTLENIGNRTAKLEIVDGLQNLQPFGIENATYQSASCLTDAYKHNECDLETGMGIFSLTAQIHDRPQAAEVLKATTVWSVGLENPIVLLSTNSLRDFCSGRPIQGERLSKGQRGDYLVGDAFHLEPGEQRTWRLVADVARDHGQVAQLQTMLTSATNAEQQLSESLACDHQDLVRSVASADGLQATGNELDSVHHFANVLFNNLRGGVFASNYDVELFDFSEFLASRNHKAYVRSLGFVTELPSTICYVELIQRVREQQDQDLLRLTLEYLPLIFGRRHGDPSRPWNRFNIRTENDDGTHAYHYEGNWRDIFQNWEALGFSFPFFFPSMIAKFLNASTVDGFNPYRITKDGIDWEVPDPENPWSNIGYWGDHQIIYLAKLLEACQQHFPGLLEDQLQNDIYCYADVPYRIKSFEDLVSDSRDTIRFDLALSKDLEGRVEELGEDGKLLRASSGKTCYVNLVEKLLVPVLSKLSNLVLDGGIWMNTQRPEWNDANNALAGNGLSVVTTCHLHRYIHLLRDLLRGAEVQSVDISSEVVEWFLASRKILQSNLPMLQEPVVTDTDRGNLLDALGRAFCDYRSTVYENGFSGKQQLSLSDLLSFIDDAASYLDHTIEANVRPDGLYHAYNLLRQQEDPSVVEVSHLCEMLEGQVAALSTRKMQPTEAIELVEKMYDSPLFRADQNSFLLYPDRVLPGFRDRNVIPSERAQGIELIRRQLEGGETSLVSQCARGQYHFHWEIQRESDLLECLESLSTDPEWTALVEQDTAAVQELFDEVFHHSQFTGRSGAMYGYEGLGSIYWHMVSKLLLAVQEIFFRAVDEKASETTIRSLRDTYYRVRQGLSLHKSPEEYGAFPTDPYSHTPGHLGAQQPGMTGQVKEEVLTRRGELGVRIDQGQISFEPTLLRKEEFVDEATVFKSYDLQGQEEAVEIPAGSLAFTIYQTLIIYHLAAGGESVEIQYSNGEQARVGEHQLDSKTSESLFLRTGQISRIEVQVSPEMLFRS